MTNFKQATNYKFKIPNKKISNLSFGIGILFGIVILTFGIPYHASGQSEIILSKRVTKSDLQTGYTITTQEKDAYITIKPNTLNHSAFVELIKPEFYPATLLDKDLVSNVYHYAILPATDNQLSNSIALNMLYSSEEARYKEIYIFDQNLSSWQNLEGSINTKTRTLTAQTSQASGFIAVFADHLDKSEYLKEKINSESMLILDAKTGEILLERGSEIQRPIASLTKLMTAAVFLDHNPGWNAKISMKAQDDTIPSKIYVKTGDVFTTHDLFYATLIKSANNAAKALARSTGLTHQEFVDKMNQKAKDLGMENTHYVEVTGLSSENVSTAHDLMILSKNLFADMTFLQATTPKYFTIATATGKRISMQNSNKLINLPYTILGSKTGFTYEAGRCLTMKAKNKSGKEVVAITLGADQIGAQWDDMRILLDATLEE